MSHQKALSMTARRSKDPSICANMVLESNEIDNICARACFPSGSGKSWIIRFRNRMGPMEADDINSAARHAARRAFLGRGAASIGTAALASLLPHSGVARASATEAASGQGVINPLHLAPKAKRIIFLTMAGGPS